ncbi:MAG: peptidylprolyl isomerase [Pseudomonadota bacterium]
MFKKSLLISSLLVTLSTSAWAAVDTTIVATVNGKDIIAEELIMTAQQNRIDYKVLNDLQKKLLLNGLINRILVANEARKQKMDQEPGTKLKLDALVDSVLAATLLEKETAKQKFTDDEIKAYYDKKILTNTPKEYNARHILVKEEALATEIYAQLKDADVNKFGEVAMEKSIDKGSAIKGGSLGWFKTETMVPSFGKAVQSASKGKVVAPIKSQFGWHIILVEDTKDLPPRTFEDSKAGIEQTLTKEKISDYLDGLEKAATIDIKIGK